MTSGRLKAYLYLLCTALLWGISAPIVKYTLSFVTPISFLFYRFFLINLLLSLPLLKMFKKQSLSFKKFRQLFLIGFLGGPVTLLLIFQGTSLTTSLSSSLIVAMAPILIIIAGALFLKEKVTRQENLGLIIVLFGTLITVLQPLLKNSSFCPQNLQGNLLVFLSNLSWTYYVIAVKKKTRSLSPLVPTAITFFSGLVTFTPLFIWEKTATATPLLPPASALPGILYMAIFASIIAYTTYNLGVSLIEASEATLFTYLQPFFAAPLSFFWLKEPLAPAFLAGALITSLGIIITSWKPKPAPKTTSPED